MGKGQKKAGSQYVRVLFNDGTIGSLTDGQLLERFTARGSETAEIAFATLVERHGPMVLRVCRSVLRDPHEAHDAFQATFLVLVRRAGSLWVRDSLGPWLHQVAYRTAMCARAAATRRRRHELHAAELAGPTSSEEDRDDLGVVLHDEVNRLPGRCRAVVVLCYFDGLSPEQAARQLGCPVGTVQSRLARGRERLRSRLTRRGLAPALGALGAQAASEAAVLPAALMVATTQAALARPGAAAVASGPVIRLVKGVLRSMFLIKLRTVALTVIALATLAAGAGVLVQKARAGRLQPNLDQIRAELGAQGADAAGKGEPGTESSPPPQNLSWNDTTPAERQRVVQQLAAQSKTNYEKIMTWKGAYSYVLRQYLDSPFVAQALNVDLPNPNQTKKVSGPLMQDFESVLTFALDVNAEAIYRDSTTSRMRFLKIGTNEEVTIPNVTADEHRSIVTPELYIQFRPKDRTTSSFLPDHPEARMKRRAERFAAREAQMREGGSLDPRAFFKFDPVNSFWAYLERCQQAFREYLENEPKPGDEPRLKIERADGPGGRWYRAQMGFTAPGALMLWVSTLWSPQAGYNPASMITTRDKPDGKIESKIEWQWKVIDGIYVPSTIKEWVYRTPGGGLSKEQHTTLKECVLNGPLGPHQFDEQGLGLNDGDLVLNHLERVAYIVKDGKAVKLANFGERSILHPALAKPAPERSSRSRSKPAGRIFTTASLATDDAGRPISSVVAVDPESGHVTKVFDESPGRLMVSPDARIVAYASGDLSANTPPPERMRLSLWSRAVAGSDSPRRIVRLEGAGYGALPVWSANSKQIIVSIPSGDELLKRPAFSTFRIDADGSHRVSLKIPAQDMVHDWSADGAWVVTTSTRNAKIGWQLYIMHPDGTDARQITEGGNPFYVRFSPDGRRLLYSDGAGKDRWGVWVVGFDGKDRRRIFPTARTTASACWSPDGQQIAVAIQGATPEERGRLEIVNLDGTHRTLLTMPGQDIADMPDWR
jgi:RNA polymerase sigma factor (sigma-70 family)